MNTKRFVRGLALLGALLGITTSASAIVQRDYSQVLVQHQTEMRACMGEHRGDVTVSIHVNGRGRLQQGSIDTASSDGMREGGECVLREARSWQFQTSTSGARVTYLLTATDRAVQVRRARR